MIKMVNYNRMNKILEEEGTIERSKAEEDSWAEHLVIVGQREAEDSAMELEKGVE